MQVSEALFPNSDKRVNELQLLSFIISRKKASVLLPNHYYWHGIGTDKIHKAHWTRENFLCIWFNGHEKDKCKEQCNLCKSCS